MLESLNTSLRLHILDQGFPTEINRGPHTCQSSLKAGRMKQNEGSSQIVQIILTIIPILLATIQWINWAENRNTVLLGLII